MHTFYIYPRRSNERGNLDPSLFTSCFKCMQKIEDRFRPRISPGVHFKKEKNTFPPPNQVLLDGGAKRDIDLRICYKKWCEKPLSDRNILGLSEPGGKRWGKAVFARALLARPGTPRSNLRLARANGSSPLLSWTFRTTLATEWIVSLVAVL